MNCGELLTESVHVDVNSEATKQMEGTKHATLSCSKLDFSVIFGGVM